MHDADAAQIRQSIQELGKTVAQSLEGVRTEMNGYNRELGEQSSLIETQTGQITEIFTRLNKPEEYCGLGKHLSKVVDEHKKEPHNGKLPRAARPAVVAGTGAGAGAGLFLIIKVVEGIIAHFKGVPPP